MSPDQIASVLGKPLKINKLTLANRMIMGPMAANGPEKDGSAGDQTVAFFEARARGGIGMIIIGGMAASRRPIEEITSNLRPLRIDDDRYLPGFQRLAAAVHAHNVPIIAEIAPSMGRMAGNDPISASPKNVVIPKGRLPRGVNSPTDVVTPVPREARIEEIKQFEQDMIEAAGRVQRAGLDGVEIAAMMSYFAASFLTPRTNWRTDEYGGSVENRARMLVNIVSGMRKRVGPDFVIGLRITSNEYLPDGQGAEGYAAIAKLVEAAGADYVALSPACYESQDVNLSPVDGLMIDSGDARIFKEALSIPVFVQGLHDPAMAAKALADGQGDAVMLARPTLADPNYARKVLEGRPETIVKCTRDNTCVKRMVFGMPIRCEVNPQMGVEGRRGGLPPLDRVVKAPVEEAILKLTASRRLMDLAGAVMAKKGR